MLGFGSHTGPVKRRNDGMFDVSLSDDERAGLRLWPMELIKQIQSGEDDGSTFRLFPPGYSQDIVKQIEYDSLMRDTLQESHVESLRTLETIADETTISEQQLDAFVRAVNQLRLVLGTRLNITANMSEDDLPDDENALRAHSLYQYLSYLQEAGVEALFEALPDGPEYP